MANLTLWRAWWDWSALKVESFEVEEKPKIYRVITNHAAANWSPYIRKEDVGVKFFFSRVEALQDFITRCGQAIAWCEADIRKETIGRNEALALLKEAK